MRGHGGGGGGVNEPYILMLIFFQNISLKKWIIFGAVCRSFSFINKKILIEILVLVFVRYSFFLRWILCLINWFCYWIAKINICEKIIVMISKVIAICVFLFFVTLIISLL